MEYVVITGASSGIGKDLTNLLILRGLKVIGISREKIIKDGVIPIICDLSKVDDIENIIKPYLKYSIIGVINCAGFGFFEPHEQLSISTITKMVAVNLTAPMILSKLLLRSIKKYQGFIINISSIEAVRSSKFSALYTATKSGLRSFSLALFEEVRKSGVQVITINPDMTDTNFFNTLRFMPDKECAIDVKSITQCVNLILDLPKQATISELTIRAQLFKIKNKNLIKNLDT